MNTKATIKLKSPCVGICTLDSAGKYCTGCGRTIEQIISRGKTR
jgi:predicted Fe-S protein YdhL (DUF1289 family)